MLLVQLIALAGALATNGTSSPAGGRRRGEGGGSGDAKRIYSFKQVGGGGCPYTASWLAHVNLYRAITWYVDSTKMEAASFRIFDTARLKFQVADPDAYYVHHMSMYEHHIHRKIGFEAAQRETLTMSKAAMQGECGNLKIRKTKEYLALVPFFGGLPPGVTKDFSKVRLWPAWKCAPSPVEPHIQAHQPSLPILLKVQSIGQGKRYGWTLHALETPRRPDIQARRPLLLTTGRYALWPAWKCV